MSFFKGSSSWNNGQAVEAEFYSLLLLRDPEARKATQQEQFNHVDYVSYHGTFDVKAMGQLRRNDHRQQGEFRWLELNNVRGDVGWLLAEDMDYLAFERLDDFLIVRREDVRLLAKELCTFDYVTSAGNALYNLYSRSGRKDLLTVIRTDDMLVLDHRVWDKH